MKRSIHCRNAHDFACTAVGADAFVRVALLKARNTMIDKLLNLAHKFNPMPIGLRRDATAASRGPDGGVGRQKGLRGTSHEARRGGVQTMETWRRKMAQSRRGVPSVRIGTGDERLPDADEETRKGKQNNGNKTNREDPAEEAEQDARPMHSGCALARV